MDISNGLLELDVKAPQQFLSDDFRFTMSRNWNNQTWSREIYSIPESDSFSFARVWDYQPLKENGRNLSFQSNNVSYQWRDEIAEFYTNDSVAVKFITEEDKMTAKFGWNGFDIVTCTGECEAETTIQVVTYKPP